MRPLISLASLANTRSEILSASGRSVGAIRQHHLEDTSTAQQKRALVAFSEYCLCDIHDADLSHSLVSTVRFDNLKALLPS